MNVSLNLLKEYVKIDDSIEIKEIVDRLTMSGSKVEKYVPFGKAVTGVYTGRVDKIEPHPTEKTMFVVTLTLGETNYIAVAKIADITIGDIVPVALPDAEIVGKVVKAGSIYGVTSECMICHILDLGLTKELFPLVKPSGLICLPNDVALGQDITKVLGLGDYIIEFEITPNRPDCLSVEGLARELAVTFDMPCTPLWQDRTTQFEYVDSVDNMSVKLKTENCNNYVLNVIKNVCIKPSPFALQLKLIKCGYPVKNNIVDITNYVMLEMGQPLHAFDRDKITGDILVRQAKIDEKITILDKTTKELDENTMVIADDSTAVVAIAGVMGGLNSGIADTTTAVVIESANFKRGSIRNTAKRLGIRTDASGKYERGLPLELTERAMNRVIDLVKATQSGDLSYQVVKKENSKGEPRIIKVAYEEINRIIGIEVKKEQVDAILNKLQLTVQDGYATIPYYRYDIERTEDLAEEIARIYGYDKLPSTLPETDLTFGRRTNMQQFEDTIKQLCVHSGYSEIYNYTFFSKETLKRAFADTTTKEHQLVKILNPLSIDFGYMRTTTVPLMLEALERNATRKNSEVKLFELGKVFLKAENIQKGLLCEEKQYLTLGMYSEQQDFYQTKAVIERMLNYFKVEYNIQRSKESFLHPGIAADFWVNGEIVATIGKVNPVILANYDLPENTYLAIIYLEPLFNARLLDIKFVELPKYPSVERDIAFVIDEQVLSCEIITEIKKIDSDIVEHVTLFDVYQGSQIEKGKKSMAYRIILRRSDKTLEEAEITTFMEKLMKLLDTKWHAKIRK